MSAVEAAILATDFGYTVIKAVIPMTSVDYLITRAIIPEAFQLSEPPLLVVWWLKPLFQRSMPGV